MCLNLPFLNFQLWVIIQVPKVKDWTSHMYNGQQDQGKHGKKIHALIYKGKNRNVTLDNHYKPLPVSLEDCFGL